MLRSTAWYPPRCYQHRGPSLVYLVVALLAVAAQPVPPLQGVVACLGEGTLRHVHGLVLVEHQLDEAEQGHGLLLPLAAYLVVVCLRMLEIGLQLIERGNILKHLPCLGRGVLYLLELSPVIKSF